MRKFGEKLVEMVQRKEGDEDVDFKKGITPEEFDVLQYLAGYVIKSLTRKMQRISTDGSKKMIFLLNVMTDPFVVDFSPKPVDLELQPITFLLRCQDNSLWVGN